MTRSSIRDNRHENASYHYGTDKDRKLTQWDSSESRDKRRASIQCVKRRSEKPQNIDR